jgi:GNAT superfamily N-acetyltransferase
VSAIADAFSRPVDEVSIRPARSDDLRAAAAIYAAVDLQQHRRMHPLTRMTEGDPVETTNLAVADLQLLHAENPRQVWVAEREEIVGMAAAAFRGRHWHLTYLFVSSDSQARGIGGELLRQIHEAGRAAGCTVFTLQASDDPRALSRYFRLGLIPGPPNVVWSAADPLFPVLGLDDRMEATALRLDDAAALNTIADIDKAVRGVTRMGDICRWLGEDATGALLTNRETGTPAGYYLISPAAGTSRIGPVASIDETAFGDVFRHALAAAGGHASGSKWELAVPGENRAVIASLFAARFRPILGLPFFASAPIGRFDRYIFHDLDLL